MGSTSTTVTANWTVVQDASGFPTTVSGGDVTAYANRSTPPFTGKAWSDVDLMAAIPTGATITDMTFELTVQLGGGGRQTSTVACAPRLQFIDKAQYLAGTFLLGYGIYGAGGVGDLPNDTAAHDIVYDNNTYGAVSGGGGISDVNAFAAALSDASTPVILEAQGPQNATTGTGLTYSAPLTITFFYDLSAPLVLPPLRQYPREDGLGASSARRVFPPPRSVQASNRRAGGYL